MDTACSFGENIKSERIHNLRSLKDAEWDLHTLLTIYDGLFDRAVQINNAAVGTLMALAKKYPAVEHEFSPIALLIYSMPSFTVASGYRPRIFHTLCHLNTPVADHNIELLMNNYLRNEDFEQFLNILIKAGKMDLISKIRQKQFSKTKQQILNRTLGVAEPERPQE